MHQPAIDRPRTLEEFRIWHERQPEVWEFVGGAASMMAPGSRAHTLLKSRMARMLGAGLEGTGCEALVDGAVVEVEGSSLIPDVVVSCGPPDLTTPRIDEPTIIVEVLSPSGEEDDLGRKLMLYLRIPTVRHYLTIAQDSRRVIHHERRDDLDGRFLTSLVTGGRLRLDPPGVDLDVTRLYDGIVP